MTAALHWLCECKKKLFKKKKIYTYTYTFLSIISEKSFDMNYILNPALLHGQTSEKEGHDLSSWLYHQCIAALLMLFSEYTAPTVIKWQKLSHLLPAMIQGLQGNRVRATYPNQRWFPWEIHTTWKMATSGGVRP